MTSQAGLEESKAGKNRTGQNHTGHVAAIAKIAVMAAVICILGPLSVPIGPVPVTTGLLGIFLAVYILGGVSGGISVLLYILIGFAGLPVFAGFKAGPSVLFGPTGGYIIGYIFLAFISGWFVKKFRKTSVKNLIFQFLGMVLGLAVCYAFGTAWLALSMKLSFQAALAAGVLPFIGFDIAKIVASMLIGKAVVAALNKAGLMED